jgi:hypothetical protein
VPITITIAIISYRQATIAFPINNKQPSRVAARLTREIRTSKVAAKERRAVAKAPKVPHPSREMQLSILKLIAELLKRQNAIAIEKWVRNEGTS